MVWYWGGTWGSVPVRQSPPNQQHSQPFTRSLDQQPPNFPRLEERGGKKSIDWEVKQSDSCQMNFQICKNSHRSLRTPGYVQEGLWSLEILAVVHSQGCCKHSEFAKRTNRTSSIKVSSYFTHVSSATTLVGQMETVRQISCYCWLGVAFHLSWKIYSESCIKTGYNIEHTFIAYGPWKAGDLPNNNHIIMKKLTCSLWNIASREWHKNKIKS